MDNLEHQTAMNKLTGMNELQPTAAGEDGIAKSEAGYSWTQTDEELEIVVPLISNAGPVLTSKDARAAGLKVQYFPKKITVHFSGEELLSLNFFASVDPDGCTWTLDPSDKGTSLVVTCEKADGVCHGPGLQFDPLTTNELSIVVID